MVLKKSVVFRNVLAFFLYSTLLLFVLSKGKTEVFSLAMMICIHIVALIGLATMNLSKRETKLAKDYLISILLIMALGFGSCLLFSS